MINDDQFDLNMGTVSTLSFRPLSLAAQSVADGSISNDELPIAAPTGVYGCALLMPLAGELAGTSDPSEIGTSAGSQPSVLSLGTSGIRDLPLSCLSISARLVFERSLLFTLGLVDGPEVSAWERACTCPATRSSPKGEAQVLAFRLDHCHSGWSQIMPTLRPFRESICNYVRSID